MGKCEHEAGEIDFGDLLSIDTESVVFAFTERCQECGKIIDEGILTYRRKD